MRAGRHYVMFTVESLAGSDNAFKLLVGATKPNWTAFQPWQTEDAEPRFLLWFAVGDGSPQAARRGGGVGISWVGMQSAEEGDRIGMLIDLTVGTLTVYKNDELLGVMATGLTNGEYVLCEWAISMHHDGDSVRVDSAPMPREPVLTAEELQAVAAANTEAAAPDLAEAEAGDDY